MRKEIGLMEGMKKITKEYVKGMRVHNELTVISPPTVPECVAKWFEEELAEAKEMVEKRSTEELFDNLKEMNRDVREYTCGIQVILDELNAREKQNKEER
ncbi:hypothetical protein ARW27_11280 [Listeria monocytogenes]|nr:hypothetical protein [Listeria monocytogenes]